MIISTITKNLPWLAITVSVLSSLAVANVNPTQRALRADEEAPTGFVESINFNDFFEDVGLQGAHSEPAATHQSYEDAQESRRNGAAVNEYGDEGFIPSDPMAGFEASPSNLYEITSDQDFYASESNPFEDFYGFEDRMDHAHSSPFASSRHRDIYSSPSEHRELSSADFRDFGPPKGFFDDVFEGELTKAQSAQQEEQQKQEEVKEDPSKKKCETVVKDKMTCEVCNDGYGGFSEHCSHSLNSGKDQKYANSRRKAQDKIYKPHGPDAGLHPRETDEHDHSSGRQASNPEPRNYPKERSVRKKQRQQPQEDHSYEEESLPSATAPAYDDEQPNAPKRHVRRHHNVSPASNQRHGKKSDDVYSESTADAVHTPKKKPNKNRHFGKDSFYDSYPDHEIDHHGSSSAKILKPIDSEQNFKILNKMMKKFSKKDRNNCKKRVTKKGMTCYVCPNKHGQVDEECMYENDDPSKGVHMMYKEESSY